MIGRSIVFFASFLALVGSALAQGSAVADLDPTNFDTVVGNNQGVLVEFFAPWCGHCKNLAPIWEELGAAFSHAKDKVVIAKVDADAHRELGTKFGVQGFPVRCINTLLIQRRRSSGSPKDPARQRNTMVDVSWPTWQSLLQTRLELLARLKRWLLR